MYQERKQEMILINKESITSLRHGEIPVSEVKYTINNPQDLTSVLEHVASYLRAAGFSFIQELSYTTYTYTEDGIYDKPFKCSPEGEETVDVKQEEGENL